MDFVEVGQHYTFAKTVGETDVTLFAGITGDFSDTHTNDQYMQEKSNLGGRIAHGALIVGFTHSIAHVIPSVRRTRRGWHRPSRQPSQSRPYIA